MAAQDHLNLLLRRLEKAEREREWFRCLLQRCQWPEGRCPICFAYYGAGHEKDCALARVVKGGGND